MLIFSSCEVQKVEEKPVKKKKEDNPVVMVEKPVKKEEYIPKFDGVYQIYRKKLLSKLQESVNSQNITNQEANFKIEKYQESIDNLKFKKQLDDELILIIEDLVNKSQLLVDSTKSKYIIKL